MKEETALFFVVAIANAPAVGGGGGTGKITTLYTFADCVKIAAAK